MKNYIYYILFSVVVFLSGCEDLDLTPDSASSSGNFYSNQAELEIALNSLYEKKLFKIDDDTWTDDHWNRGSGTNAITNGTINSETSFPRNYWDHLYEGIARANTLLKNMESAGNNTEQSILNRIEAEARVLRAYYYSVLITHFGNVVFTTEILTLEESLGVQRTDKNNIKQFIYDELDQMAPLLPIEFSDSELMRVTRGFALGIKTRLALYMKDFSIARDAAEEVMNLGVYDLFEDYHSLFQKANTRDNEIIFSTPQSVEFGVTNNDDVGTFTRGHITRNSGGWGSQIPTWSMMDVYECIDGLTIDKSPLYDPHDPFASRDPRLTASIVEFGTSHLGFDYQPHPDSTEVWSDKLAARVSNKDTRTNAAFASYTGLVWHKWVEQDWADNQDSDNARIVLRYADILLMYAEAKIELNEIDISVLDAINSVRARAYGVDFNDTGNYPAVTTLDQAALRGILRRERRVELVHEGLRYMDLIRWDLANKALNTTIVGLPNPANQDRSQWPFTDAALPEIDENGIVTHNAVLAAGGARVLATFTFDVNKQNLWPIPAADRLLNENLTQNPGY
ncbi:RagB/SusD family nutrient uptake outer membrane protein [Fulvivirgaceae bacterium BMA12]|uniref:RagB/SusD family nutrient uptake outer membrane protein n=1 Tax=Agaribacillus aureus TaxID=3051825 RepID=A0ABT8LAU8_9BACT|nr:RagB/SusD family nutrient uptake outer membrane protein [Fulvivirgaceae bacterium BMA12]